jgi:TPR repeat protein
MLIATIKICCNSFLSGRYLAMTLGAAFALCGCERRSDSLSLPKTSGAAAETTNALQVGFDPAWEQLPANFTDYNLRRKLRIGTPSTSRYFRQAQVGLLHIQLFKSRNNPDDLPRLSFESGVRPGGSWVGQNAFGAKRIVTESITAEDWLFLKNAHELQCIETEKDDILLMKFVVPVPSPDHDNLRYLLLFTLGNSTSQTGPFTTSEPTFTHPVESKLEVTKLEGSASAIWFFDQPSGKIYRKINLKEPSNWRFEVERTAEAGDADAADWLADHAQRKSVNELKWRRIAAANGSVISQKELQNTSSFGLGVVDLKDRAERGEPNAILQLYRHYGSNFIYDAEAERCAQLLFAARSESAIQTEMEKLQAQTFRRRFDDEVWKTYSKLTKEVVEKEKQQKLQALREQAAQQAELDRVATDQRVVKWQTEQADKGSAYAQSALGHRYLKGEGVPLNAKLGIELLEKAAAQGDSDAKKTLEQQRRKPK